MDYDRSRTEAAKGRGGLWAAAVKLARTTPFLGVPSCIQKQSHCSWSFSDNRAEWPAMKQKAWLLQPSHLPWASPANRAPPALHQLKTISEHQFFVQWSFQCFFLLIRVGPESPVLPPLLLRHKKKIFPCLLTGTSLLSSCSDWRPNKVFHVTKNKQAHSGRLESACVEMRDESGPLSVLFWVFPLHNSWDESVSEKHIFLQLDSELLTQVPISARQ